MKKKTSAPELAKMFGTTVARAQESILKAKLTSAVSKSIKKSGITHEELAKRSGIPRSAVTGILSGSLQKVTVDRLLRLAEAVNLTVEFKIKEAA